MDFNELDTELGVKILESLKILLKNKDVVIDFKLPTNEILEETVITHEEHYYKMTKTLVINEIDDIDPKYLKFMNMKTLSDIKDMNHQQMVNHIKKNTKGLFFLRPFLGKKIVKNQLRSITFKIIYNNVHIDLQKIDYDRLNYYTKYVYKLQQLHNLNQLLGIDKEYKIIFDDDVSATNMYFSMYDSLGDIISPPDKK